MRLGKTHVQVQCMMDVLISASPLVYVWEAVLFCLSVDFFFIYTVTATRTAGAGSAGIPAEARTHMSAAQASMRV